MKDGKIGRMAKKESDLQEQAGEFGDPIDKDESEWRRLTYTDKDLQPYLWERHLRIAYYLYLSNPLCFRLLELSKDFAIGEGISFKAKDPRVQETLEAFWDDDVNNLELRQFDMALELALSGEQVYVPAVNPFSGFVRLESVDPLQVEEVRPCKENANLPQYLTIKATATKPKRKLQIIYRETEPYAKDFGMLTGETFYFAVNKVTNATRGHSDILALIDWIEGYDEFLYGQLERSQLQNMHLWDVTVTGADDIVIEDLAKKQRKPKSGSVRYHNEKVKWDVITPKFNAKEAVEEARMIRQHILTGHGTPETWVSEGGFTNKATAREMSVPTLKRLTTRQKFIKFMFRRIFQFVIDQAILHRRLPAGIDKTVAVNIPTVERDLEELSNVLVKLTNALMIARENDWVEDEVAKAFFNFFMERFGFEMNRFMKNKSKPNEQENYFRVAKQLERYAGKEEKEKNT